MVGSAGGTEDIIQIGKELLKPELPLTLRLIGLRVTKLKDLRADAESKTRGIKRVRVSSPNLSTGRVNSGYQFFNSGTSGGSPTKKRRQDDVSFGEGEEDLPQLSQDGFATSMPGYTDEADAEAEHLAEAADMDEQDTKPHSKMGMRPPSSSTSTAPKSSSLAPGPSSPRSKRSPRPTNHDREASLSMTPPLLECPICGKMLETDNQGLNEHIDFCLSKQAIKEAQTASLKPPSHSGSSSHAKKRGSKPPPSKATTKGHSEGLLKFRKKG